MVEEIAVVTRVDTGRIWIKGRGSGACGACVKQAGCGTAALGKLLPKREFVIESSLPVKAGDEVRVAIDDSHLVFSSVLLYLLPLLIMLSGIGLATWLLPGELAERWLPEIALITLLAAFWGIHKIQALVLRFWPFSPSIIGKV